MRRESVIVVLLLFSWGLVSVAVAQSPTGSGSVASEERKPAVRYRRRGLVEGRRREPGSDNGRQPTDVQTIFVVTHEAG